MTYKTADLVDTHDAEVRLCHLPFQLYGTRRRFHGRIVTVQTFEDNSLVRQTLEADGAGQVLVVDGGGSTRVALLGDMIAELAVAHRWEGVVINGAIRDSVEIGLLDVGVCALGRSPKKSSKTGSGAVGVTVTFGEVEFVPGGAVYVDDDGVLVADHLLDLP
jgi:regulator of ribonuclease activity A